MAFTENPILIVRQFAELFVYLVQIKVQVGIVGYKLAMRKERMVADYKSRL